jgi:hypothetical protein
MLKKRKYLEEAVSVPAAPAVVPAAVTAAPVPVHRPAPQSTFAEKLKSALGRDLR